MKRVKRIVKYLFKWGYPPNHLQILYLILLSETISYVFQLALLLKILSKIPETASQLFYFLLLPNIFVRERNISTARFQHLPPVNMIR